MSGLLRGLSLLLSGRGAVLPTASASAGEERLGVEVLFNRQTEEFRVVTSMSLHFAQDVQHDLSTVASPRHGTHAYIVALGQVMPAQRSKGQTS